MILAIVVVAKNIKTVMVNNKNLKSEEQTRFFIDTFVNHLSFLGR